MCKGEIYKFLVNKTNFFQKKKINDDNLSFILMGGKYIVVRLRKQWEEMPANLAWDS